MAKSIFRLTCSYNGEIKSIKEISSEIVGLIFSLKKINTTFDCVHYASDAAPKEINIQDENIAISELSNYILNSYIHEIKSDNKEIDINYSWNEGFRVSIIFENQKENCFTITGQYGCQNYPEVNIMNFKKEYSFNWYFLALKVIVNLFNPKTASIEINVPVFRKFVNEIEIWPPLGWVTYFSHDYEIRIPDNLKGLEYENTDNGKYLILTREDFTTSKELYEEHRDRLMDLMNEIKQRIPEYSK